MLLQCWLLPAVKLFGAGNQQCMAFGYSAPLRPISSASPGREGLSSRGVAPWWAILLMPPFCSALNCFLSLFWKGVSCCLMAPQCRFTNVIKVSGAFWKQFPLPCIRSHSTAGMYGGRDGRGSQELSLCGDECPGLDVVLQHEESSRDRRSSLHS